MDIKYKLISGCPAVILLQYGGFRNKSNCEKMVMGLGGTIIRDAVHGDIELSAHEREILDSPQIQRLRWIRQLGTAFLVYPGCHHTRFEHSLGTLHCATRILKQLQRHGCEMSEDDINVIRAAALVHDVSHIPFGHTFEDERKVFPRHDSPDRLRHFLFSGELGRILARHGLAEPVFELLTGEPTWRSDVVAGYLDADLLDYLRRDSFFAGLSQAYDDRIYHYFCIAENRLAVQLARRGIQRPDARSEIVHLLRMRYFLTERVYFHHAKVIAGAMISKAVEVATAAGLEEKDLYEMSDYGLLEMLRSKWGPASAELAERVLERRLFKRAYGLTPVGVGEVKRWELAEAFHRPGAQRDQLESELAKAAGLASHQVIVYCPAPTALKEAAVPAVTPSGVAPLNRTNGGLLEIHSLEEQYRGLWRFWVFAPASHAEKVGHAAAEALGLPNEMSL